MKNQKTIKTFDILNEDGLEIRIFRGTLTEVKNQIKDWFNYNGRVFTYKEA
jgi:hypothetical protein